MRRIVILGGGTAGWMAAACLARTLGTRERTIALVESERIGTIGVGEATIPLIEAFHHILGIQSADVLRTTDATFKLGIEFVDWRRRGDTYFHPFGPIGTDMNGVAFGHHWLRHRAGGGKSALTDYSVAARAAATGRFGMVRGSGPQLHYAWHFDASLYAAMLRRLAETLGTTRIEGRVARVAHDGESGHVTALEMDDGRSIAGDFFIDCSGFRGVLIEQALGAGFDDWSRWLPCNRAVTVASAPFAEPPPFTRATARDSGWQWRIPLRHRTGNGHVFADAFLSEDAAIDALLSGIDGDPAGAPRLLRFATGMRRRGWIGNVVAMGLASGFVEPLESTAIYMVQSALAKLLPLFPRDHVNPRAVDSYNAMVAAEWERVRDFVIAHYKLTERADTPFWAHCRAMRIPDSLAERIALFEEDAAFVDAPHDLFKEASWWAVLTGQGVIPRRYHPVADTAPSAALDTQLAGMRESVADRVAQLPAHQAYLARCLVPDPRRRSAPEGGVRPAYPPARASNAVLSSDV